MKKRAYKVGLKMIVGRCYVARNHNPKSSAPERLIKIMELQKGNNSWSYGINLDLKDGTKSYLGIYRGELAYPVKGEELKKLVQIWQEKAVALIQEIADDFLT